MKETITQDEFERYERVRRLGVVNMFDVAKVAQLSGLTKPRILEIMKDYQRLKKAFITKETQ